MAKKISTRQGLSEAGVVGLVGFVFGLFIAGAIAGIFFYTHTATTFKPIRQSDLNPNEPFKFTDPLIGLSAVDTTQTSPQYSDLGNKINKYLEAQKSSGLMSAAVSFRDINAQARIVINPDEIYTPASLYKVPLMIAYYKLAEEDAGILSQELYYPEGKDLDRNQNIKSPVQLVPGQSYTIEVLIERMIRYSDNNADQLLLKNLLATNKESALRQVFSDLNINFGSLSASTDLLTAQAYTLFLRVLYNATYLDRAHSEKALALMSQTDFTQGIAASVPNNVQVSHKFGDANMVSRGSLVGVELHDCGVVYVPGHPYILCVMTKGTSLAKLESVISAVSGFIYQDIETRYP